MDTHTQYNHKIYTEYHQHRSRNKALGRAGERHTREVLGVRGVFAASRHEQESLGQMRGKRLLGREHRVQSSRVWNVWPVEGQLVVAVAVKVR